MLSNITSSLIAFIALTLAQQTYAEQSANVISQENSDKEQAASDSLPEADEAVTREHQGLFILDYQDIKLPDNERIDFIGYHLLTPINDWAYFGIGGYAPFLQGEYGGFMAFGGLLHVEKNITNNVFVNGGFSFGGGGGGKSIEQSIELSGTGGYLRGYLGLGYQFSDLSLGLNYSYMKFHQSVIDNGQLGLFLEVPFSVSTSPYGSVGEAFTLSSKTSEVDAGYMLSLGLDNYKQINPTGSNKELINVADLQFSDYIWDNYYWYYAAAVGYHGLPIYNQVIVGMGGRLPVTKNMQLYGQLGIGSGGYAPELIDTGSGLLLYPKLSVEYLLSDNLGLAATAGYLYAVDGTSRNYTFGLALNHHFGKQTPSSSPQQGVYEGYRIKLSHETLANMQFRDAPLDNLNMLTFQADKLFTKNIYLPIRIAISYQAYRGYPGYGEIATGLGLQTSYHKGDNWQLFGELQVGANVEGALIRPTLGVDYSFNEDLALHSAVGYSYGSDGFRAMVFELGLTTRFTLLSL